MISIESYLRSASGEFIPISDCNTPPPDERHVAGAIEFNIDGVAIIDRSMWDDVDQLWAYILEMVPALDASGESYTYFPDQPIKLTFSNVGPDMVLVSLRSGSESRRAATGKQQLIGEVRRAGGEFFRLLSRLVPANAGAYNEIISRME
jgi:hypothetical protein